MFRTRLKRGRNSRAVPPNRRAPDVPRWAVLSAALSPGRRVDPGRPDVDSTVQLAAEIALSERPKFRYNRG